MTTPITRAGFTVVLGPLMKALARRANLDQTSTAAACSVGQPTVSRWFNAQTQPDCFELRAFARAVHVPLDVIYMLVDELWERLSLKGTGVERAEALADLKPDVVQALATLVVEDFEKGVWTNKKVSEASMKLLRGGTGAEVMTRSSFGSGRGQKHLRPDGVECSYLAEGVCNKCGAILSSPADEVQLSGPPDQPEGDEFEDSWHPGHPSNFGDQD